MQRREVLSLVSLKAQWLQRSPAAWDTWVQFLTSLQELDPCCSQPWALPSGEGWSKPWHIPGFLQTFFFTVATVIFVFNILLIFLRRGVASIVPPQLTSANLSPVHSLFFLLYFRNTKVQRNSPKWLRINCAQLWCDLYDVLCLCARFLSFDVNELAWSEVISHDLNASILVVLVSK